MKNDESIRPPDDELQEYMGDPVRPKTWRRSMFRLIWLFVVSTVLVLGICATVTFVLKEPSALYIGASLAATLLTCTVATVRKLTQR